MVLGSLLTVSVFWFLKCHSSNV